MIDLSAVLHRYDEARRAGEIAALATLVDTEGSTYRRPGARALIPMHGEVAGLVSGGCLEADLAEHARELSSSAPARLVTYDLRDDTEIDFGLGLGCKGKLGILLERIDPGDPSNPLARLERHWTSLASTPGACAVVLSGDDFGARLWYLGERFEGGEFRDAGQTGPMLERACADVLQAGRSRMIATPVAAFVEYLPARTSLAIFGAGPDVVPVVRGAKGLGWHVGVWDHREGALAQEALAACDARHAVDLERVARDLAELRVDAALVMTHNYRVDLEILRGLAGARISYVGLLGPLERSRELRETLAQSGVHLEHLFSPAGLDLGAEGPEAVALSILAEIHAVLRGRPGGSLRHRQGPIHDRIG